MKHIEIILLVVTLILGTWTSVYSFQLYNIFKHNFLLKLGRYVIFFSLFVLSQLCYTYVYKNLLSDLSSLDIHRILVIHKFFDFLAEAGLAYYLTATLFPFIGKETREPFNKVFRLTVFAVSIAYLINILDYFSITALLVNVRVHTFSSILFYSYILSVISYFLIKKKEITDLSKRKSVSIFGYFYLAGYITVFIIIIIFNNKEIYVAVLSLLLNLFPMLWLKYSYMKFYIYPVADLEKNEIIPLLIKRYNISKRESEILKLILQGKNNSEIENTLFISINTVKKHIYTVFKKLGIKSRGQLMNLVLKIQDENKH